VVVEPTKDLPRTVRGVREATGDLRARARRQSPRKPIICCTSRDRPRAAATWRWAAYERIGGSPDPRLAPFITYLAVNSVDRDRPVKSALRYAATPVVRHGGAN